MTAPLPRIDIMDMVDISLLVRRAAEPAVRDAFPVSVPERLRDRILAELVAAIEPFLHEAFGGSSNTLGNDVREFYACSKNNPALLAYGTTTPDLLLWLFVIARRLRPELIVESGVFHGSSLFTFRHACPHAEIQAFDLDLTNLLFHDDSISTHSFDWSVMPVRARSSRDLCYFDDHINNCLRIKQAYHRGFRYLVFDDSPTVAGLQADGLPGVPTAAMLAQGIEEGETMAWTWKGEKLEYAFRREHACGAAEYVDAVWPLPDIGRWTGFRNPCACLVRLLPNPDIEGPAQTTVWHAYANPYELQIRAKECAHAVSRCQWLVNAGHHAEAAALLEEILAIAPHEATAHYLLAFCLHVGGGEAARSAAHYRQALAHGFSPFWVHYNLGSLLAVQGELSEAEEHLLLAQALDAAHPGVPNVLESVRARRG